MIDTDVASYQIRLSEIIRGFTMLKILLQAYFICLFFSIGPLGLAADKIVDGIAYSENRSTNSKNFAILIGVNYTARQQELTPNGRRTLPELSNAANDAKSLALTLSRYYEGYSYDKTDDQSSITLLTDEVGSSDQLPTSHRIRAELTKLCEPGRVNEEDTFLFFFAGHGVRDRSDSEGTGDAVSLMPYDVRISDEGVPYGNEKIGVPNELFNLIKEIPAKHKMVILDCCYSGEIYNATSGFRFQQRGNVDRGDAELQKIETFQAMASCRASQLAADDGRDGNSKFTTALLDGLKYLPGRSEGDRRVWASRLLSYMTPHFDEFQRPDCRNLGYYEGEFCFNPRESSVFEEDRLTMTANELVQLKAMVVSRQGEWWFDEMPWFIPAVRSQIMFDYETSKPMVRSTDFVDLISFEKLKETAERVIKKHESQSSELNQMRLRHAKSLLTSSEPVKFVETLQKIEGELDSFLPSPSPPNIVEATESRKSVVQQGSSSELQGTSVELSAKDMHLLAVIQHALNKTREAQNSYEKAIETYQIELNARTGHASDQSEKILYGLCRADYGEFLGKIKESHRSADEFHAARNLIVPTSSIAERSSDENRKEVATAYCAIFLMCKEADARKAINHWSKAENLYEEAINNADAFARNHFLHAHVYRRSAWGRFVRWQIEEAKNHFQRSNQILYKHFLDEAIDRGIVLDDEFEYQFDNINLNTKLPSVFRESKNHSSKVAFLHNLHGIAMATRFQGDSVRAAEQYRWLTIEVEDALARFLDSDSDTDLERQYIERIVNTLERLGDCNLFGEPLARDLSEAIDDYRRAANRVHLLNTSINRRAESEAVLVYKQALALSLRSPIQDTALALSMCERADKVYATGIDKAQGLFQALGELTTRTVKVLHESSSPLSPVNENSRVLAVSELRNNILQYRETIGRQPHRDQLEMCLFASKILVEENDSEDEYQIRSDSDLLLSFCRSALKNPLSDKQSESVAYLRPYYDAVMRSKLRSPVANAKAMLEVQFEANMGEQYVKPQKAIPILATYFLDNSCYLIMELPMETCECICISDLYSPNHVKQATLGGEQLPMPNDVTHALTRWRQRYNKSEKQVVDLRWQMPKRNELDPIQITTNYRLRDGDLPELSIAESGQFPFVLPKEEGFVSKNFNDLNPHLSTSNLGATSND